MLNSAKKTTTKKKKKKKNTRTKSKERLNTKRSVVNTTKTQVISYGNTKQRMQVAVYNSSWKHLRVKMTSPVLHLHVYNKK